jgi:hypothetical protein
MPQALPGAQNIARIDRAKLLRAEPLAARWQNWDLFWTDDESLILWNTQ